MKEGWTLKKLGEISDFEGGSQPPKSTFVDQPKAGYIRLLQIRDFKSDHRAVYVPNSKKNRICKSEDIMIGRYGASVGQILRGKSGAYNVALIKTIPNTSVIDREFFYWYLISALFQTDLLSVADRSAQAGFSKSDIAQFKVPLPSLPEQKHIVAILDEASEGIDTAVANAEQNIANARELFATSLKAVFARRGAGWEKITLEALLERGWIKSHLDGNHGGDYPRKEEFISTGVPYISANCIVDDHIDMARAKYLSPSRAALLRKGIARHRDVIFAHNATVGPVAILHTEDEKVILGTSLTYYRCNDKYILPEYLSHFMRSSIFKDQYLQIMRQSTRNQIPITKQREFYHVIPPIAEQESIVDQLDSIFENGRRLEVIYRHKLVTLADLKLAILQKAFAGQLAMRPGHMLSEAAE